MATTRAFTSTYTRIELIKTQFRVTLRRTTLIENDTLEVIERAIDNKWIKELTIYAFDYYNYCRGELTLIIDWNEFDIHMSQGNVKVAIDDQMWNNQTAVEIDELIRLFNKFVQSKGLQTRFVVQYPSHLDSNYINSQLGFVTADPVTWAKGGTINESLSIEELPELKIGLRLID